MAFENYNEVFQSQHWINIEKEVLEKVKPIISLDIKNKLVSELISEMTEKLAAKYFSKLYNSDKVRCAKNDNEPDIIFDKDSIEIKVAKVCNGNIVTWRGGEYSKREGTFILIAWNFCNDTKDCFKFAVYKVNLTKQDWIVSKVKNYYATIYNMNLLVANDSHICIVGNYTTSKRKISKPILESIT
jgi:hypothetical protein